MWIYIWLAVTAVALILEFITADMVSVWFAGGGLVSMILAGCGASWYIHLPVFIILSLVLMFCFRKTALRLLSKNDTKTNAESVIGKEFRLLSEISLNSPGTIKVAGVVWNAVCEDENKVVAEGTLVRVKSINGNKYVVEEVV